MGSSRNIFDDWIPDPEPGKTPSKISLLVLETPKMEHHLDEETRLALPTIVQERNHSDMTTLDFHHQVFMYLEDSLDDSDPFLLQETAASQPKEDAAGRQSKCSSSYCQEDKESWTEDDKLLDIVGSSGGTERRHFHHFHQTGIQKAEVDRRGNQLDQGNL
uniref:Uncharacterized protein n=1 Tax=Sphaerodactylus townsendi TaxID=933632 RepID=A0ACB8FMU8_9SAUR